MKTIWKYPLRIVDQQTVTMPRSACFLAAQMQHERIAVWFLVATDEVAKTDQQFHIIGTGNPYPDDVSLRYLATIQERSYFAWHLFMRV